MKGSVLYWLTNLIVATLSAQSHTQVIVVGFLQIDRTIERGQDLLLETRTTKDQIIYAYDTAKKHYVVKECVRWSGYDLWDGERTVKQKHRTRTPFFSNRIAPSKFHEFLSDLETNVDSLPKDDVYVHTSHHYLHVFISVVVDQDTTTWRKSQPFERTTSWYVGGRTILNPAIDAFLVTMLPKKFIGRTVLANLEYSDLAPHPLTRDICPAARHKWMYPLRPHPDRMPRLIYARS